MIVQELMLKLQEFPSHLEVVIGAEGIFQGSPEPTDIYIYGQDTQEGESLVIWGPKG